MMLPVIDALTTSVWLPRSAAIAMISSAALPNVALRNPPSVGPGAARQVFGRGADQSGGGHQRHGGGEKHPDRDAGLPPQPEAHGCRDQKDVQRSSR